MRSPMPTVLVTGASRGLGREFVRQYAAAGWQVIACARNPDTMSDLASESTVLQKLDLLDPANIAALADALANRPIDVLLNNAGTIGSQSFATHGLNVQRFGHSDYTDWEHVFRVNVLGPMRMAEAFVEHVAASNRKTIVTLTSMVGSISTNVSGGLYAYRSSKAAANAIMKSMSIDLAARGIIATPIHPGWAKTDMGGPSAPLDPVDAVAGVRRVIERLTPENAGRFWQFDGTEMPW